MTQKSSASFISATNLTRLLDLLGERGKVYAPEALNGREGREYYSYTVRKPGKPYTFFGYRPNQPVKMFLFSGRMKVAEYFPEGGGETSYRGEPAIIVGAASCDIESVRSLDVIFLQESFTDIFYRERRGNTLFITADCTAPRDSCLCTRAGIQPHATSGFDLNLSKVSDGFIIEAGSDKGSAVMESHASLFTKPSPAMMTERETIRKETISKVENINRDYRITRSRPELLAAMRTSDQWFEHVSTCVDCAACLFACPTCHCFLLSDQKGDPGKSLRYKAWDSCSYAGYSRMAGGSSPRLGLMERFRHRYLHKFEYYPKNFGFEACSGCGRCIEGCSGRIDQRKVFTALDRELQQAGKR